MKICDCLDSKESLISILPSFGTSWRNNQVKTLNGWTGLNTRPAIFIRRCPAHCVFRLGGVLLTTVHSRLLYIQKFISIRNFNPKKTLLSLLIRAPFGLYYWIKYSRARKSSQTLALSCTFWLLLVLTVSDPPVSLLNITD